MAPVKVAQAVHVLPTFTKPASHGVWQATPPVATKPDVQATHPKAAILAPVDFVAPVPEKSELSGQALHVA